MEKETVIDYLNVVNHYSRKLSPSRDELVVMPEPAGEQVVDYMVISAKWQEHKANMSGILKRKGE